MFNNFIYRRKNIRKSKNNRRNQMKKLILIIFLIIGLIGCYREYEIIWKDTGDDALSPIQKTKYIFGSKNEKTN